MFRLLFRFGHFTINGHAVHATGLTSEVPSHVRTDGWGVQRMSARSVLSLIGILSTHRHLNATYYAPLSR